MLTRAILAGASAQIRNMATVGGNLMQRTRCIYFQDAAGSRCNKREVASGCDAHGGFNRYHAIIGGSSACIATHPSDMCVALAALDAQIRVVGRSGNRLIPIVDFHRLPGDRPDIETALEPGEVIVAVEISGVALRPPVRLSEGPRSRELRLCTGLGRCRAVDVRATPSAMSASPSAALLRSPGERFAPRRLCAGSASPLKRLSRRHGRRVRGSRAACR